ncbi:aminopeptidase [Thermogymnomonas acidicola]|uniref:Aminopeptidase n=1 Tax=Thermogymnomonas acidicola TaxID=399579 RepID=A0AA37BSI7_9ARCH|nr:Xaa-Pro peptidase family protein [Thermogymnomonas acidicola]GGM78698.1 aminopeptidase [Thermogymnomonas acidicola]
MDPKRIFEYARETDTILIFNGDENSVDKTFFYLTGADSGLFEHSALVVTPESVKIVTSQLEEQSARATGLEVLVFRNQEEFRDIIRKEVEGVDTIGLNYSALTLSKYKEILKMIPDKEFIDVTSSIAEARRLKTEEEISKLREAARIGSEAFERVLDRLREGMTELELAAELNYEMMKAGADGPSFRSIIAFGPNASIPHYAPGDRKLRRGDFVLMDFGALYRRYCSDITRTVVFGHASEEQKYMHQVVYEAQEAAFKVIRENANGKDADLAARNVIDSTKYKGRFIHSLGHGVGLDVHDHPALTPTLDFPLKNGMVVTVEPGIYVPKFGGVRIEDDVVVRKDGNERITTAPRDLIEVS